MGPGERPGSLGASGGRGRPKGASKRLAPLWAQDLAFLAKCGLNTPIAKLNVRFGGGRDQPAGRQSGHIRFVVHPEPMQCPRWTVLGALESLGPAGAAHPISVAKTLPVEQELTAEHSLTCPVSRRRAAINQTNSTDVQRLIPARQAIFLRR